MSAMNPLCPGCLKEMPRSAASRNLFTCEPCREIIQFFDTGADRDSPKLRLKPSGVRRPIRRARAA